MNRGSDPTELLVAARSGDRRALGRLLTAIEGRSEAVPALMQAVSVVPKSTHVVGLTGAPGVGKSTTTSALVSHWRANGSRVAVLAIDPSSPFTGGALLGDRIRMDEHATDQGVFIRSMAARGHLGGLAAAAPAAVRVLAACGYDKVLIETVGVGQSEVDIVQYADSVVILMAPGMGDRIQAAKAGLLEIGDIFAVNKSDRVGARATQRELSSMISMKMLGPDEWTPPVLPLVATEGTGVLELVAALAAHSAHGEKTGAFGRRRRGRLLAEITALATEMWSDRLESASEYAEAVVDQVMDSDLDPHSAAQALFRRAADGDSQHLSERPSRPPTSS